MSSYTATTTLNVGVVQQLKPGSSFFFCCCCCSSGSKKHHKICPPWGGMAGVAGFGGMLSCQFDGGLVLHGCSFPRSLGCLEMQSTYQGLGCPCGSIESPYTYVPCTTHCTSIRPIDSGIGEVNQRYKWL